LIICDNLNAMTSQQGSENAIIDQIKNFCIANIFSKEYTFTHTHTHSTDREKIQRNKIRELIFDSVAQRTSRATSSGLVQVPLRARHAGDQRGKHLERKQDRYLFLHIDDPDLSTDSILLIFTFINITSLVNLNLSHQQLVQCY
jgi:hypothetical protein